MLTLAEALAQGGVTRPLVQGQVQAIGASTVDVVINGGVWPCQTITPIDYYPGLTVLVALDESGRGVVLGRIGPPLPLVEDAEIDSVGSTTMVVTTVAGRTVTAEYAQGTYSPGQDVWLLNTAPPRVLARGAVPPPPPEPPPAPLPTLPKQAVSTVLPVTTGTYRSGWRGDTTDLYQGDWSGRGRNTGAAFYGNGLTALSANLSLAASIQLTVRRDAGGNFAAQAPTIWTVAEKTRPSGAPTLLDSTTGPSMTIGQARTLNLPSGMVADLLDGTAGGLAIHVNSDSPYVHLAGRSAYSAAMALRVTYYR